MSDQKTIVRIRKRRNQSYQNAASMNRTSAASFQRPTYSSNSKSRKSLKSHPYLKSSKNTSSHLTINQFQYSDSEPLQNPHKAASQEAFLHKKFSRNQSLDCSMISFDPKHEKKLYDVCKRKHQAVFRLNSEKTSASRKVLELEKQDRLKKPKRKLSVFECRGSQVNHSMITLPKTNKSSNTFYGPKKNLKVPKPIKPQELLNILKTNNKNPAPKTPLGGFLKVKNVEFDKLTVIKTYTQSKRKTKHFRDFSMNFSSSYQNLNLENNLLNSNSVKSLNKTFCTTQYVPLTTYEFKKNDNSNTQSKPFQNLFRITTKKESKKSPKKPKKEPNFMMRGSRASLEPITKQNLSPIRSSTKVLN